MNIENWMNAAIARIRWLLKGQDSASSTLQALVSKFLILGTGLVTSILNARFLGPDGRGEQSAMLALVLLMSSLATLGLPVSLIYNLKRYPQDSSKLLGSALLLSTGLGIVSGIIGVVVLPYWLSKYSPEVIQWAQWFMVGVPFSTVAYVGWATLEGREEFSLVNKTRPLQIFVTLGVMLGLVGFNRLVPVTSALAYFLPTIVIPLWLLPYVWRQVSPRFLSIKTSIQRLLSYGIRAYGIDVLVTLSGQIDQLLVVGLLSPTSMGLYVVALSLSRTLNVFQQAIVMVLFPKVAARSKPEVIASVGQAARLGILLFASVAIVVVPLGSVLISILYGKEFLVTVPVFQILVFEILLSGTAQILIQVFMALEYPGVVTLSQGLGLVCSIPLMTFLIPKYGILGAGLSLLGASSSRLVFILACFPLYLGVSPPRLMLNKSDWQFALQLLERKA
jgi:O-antigen/teichoic acid export membrane protein